MQLYLFTGLTMIAFAGNSVLNRLALADGAMDASSYTLVRLLSGAVVLMLLIMRRTNGKIATAMIHSSWTSAAALFVYAGGFSFAYLALDTGMGALILFSCVQATMISCAIWRGDRPLALECTGMIIALVAFIWLVSPGLSAPDPLGASLMIAAGVAWGVYSLRGGNATDVLAATAGNFVRAVPFGIVLALVFLSQIEVTPYGLGLAILSGAVTSGLGYALWYSCLVDLTATRAAIVQLSVPAIAALGGAIFAGEAITPRLIICSVAILSGVALTLTAKANRV